MPRNQNYKKGTKFTVFKLKYLIDVLGWVEVDDRPDNYKHDNFPRLRLARHMLEEFQGQILTVVSSVGARYKDWYTVEENAYFWPVATFLFYNKMNPCKEICMHIKGMTPIFGWFICKLCGTNLKEIK